MYWFSFVYFSYNSEIVDQFPFVSNLFILFQLQAPKLSLPDRDYWIESGLDDTTTAAYYMKMVESAKYLGADNATVEKELLEALHFEMALANVN